MASARSTSPPSEPNPAHDDPPGRGEDRQDSVFPGSCEASSGNKYIDCGADSTVLQKSPTTYASTLEVKPTLTDAGLTALEAAATTALKDCLKAGDLSPNGCPIAVREASYQKIDRDSITWKLPDDALANLKPRLDYRNPALVKASAFIPFIFSASGTQFDRAAEFGPRTLTAFTTLKAKLTQEPVKVAFSN